MTLDVERGPEKDLRFLDISTKYKSNFVRGHLLAFHTSLMRAAIGKGYTFRIAAVAGRVAVGDDHVAVRFRDQTWETVASETENFLRSQERTVCIVYEGSLAAVGAFKQVARRSPEHIFIINLFLNEIASEAASKGSLRREDSSTNDELIHDFPGNLCLTADTQRRALIGRSLGLPIVGTWPHHTSLDTSLDPVEPQRGRVAITAAEWQLRNNRETVTDINVALGCSRARAGQLQFKLIGSVPQKSRGELIDRYRHLRSLDGALDAPLSASDYASAIGQASLVWLPTQGVYGDQSSGKALDALVMGRPLLAPAGTFGQQEQERFVPGAPTYRNRSELLELLDVLPVLLPRWSDETAAARSEAIRRYSPDRSIDVLLAHALECGQP
jgi:hypothetical protein